MLTYAQLAAHVLALPYSVEVVHSARERGLDAQLQMAADWWMLARCQVLRLSLLRLYKGSIKALLRLH